jgi:hypothetical protein
MLQPPRDYRDVPEQTYYQRIEGHAGVGIYVRPPIPRQIAESLRRSHKLGLPFAFAWHVALRKLALPHESAERDAWRALLAEETYVHLWRCAYERRRYEPLESIGQMRAVLEPAEVADARHRVEHHQAA